MENEIKYVVRAYTELETLLTEFGWRDIEQGYLNPNTRVREVTYENRSKRHFFTYKQRLPNGHNLEIETPIDRDQFDEAWPFTEERLRKRRVSIEFHNCDWDIDFYRWSQPYFVLAEVEMPLDMERPNAILPQLQEHVVY